MRRRLLLALVPLAGLLGAIAACQQKPVALGLAMSDPQGLLDQATTVKLSVFDQTSGDCDKTTGHVKTIPSSAQTFKLSDSGCASGQSWCATIHLDEDGSSKTFAIVASNASGVVAEGCVAATIDQDPLDVEIQAHRYNPPGCCNNGLLEAGEQCDTGVIASPSCSGGAPGECTGIQDDPVCFCDCTSKEVLLSIDDTGAPGLTNGAANSKTNLALGFGPGGSQNPSVLRAVFTSTDASAIGGSDIHERFLGGDLYPLSEPAPLSLQLRLPLACDDVKGTGLPSQQGSPSLAAISSNTVAIVYASDEAQGGGKFDVYLNAQTADGCADRKPCATDADCQTTCNGTTCEPAVKVTRDNLDSVSEPRVSAGAPGQALVTWSRGTSVFARIWQEKGGLVPALAELPITTTGSNARVAGSTDHWFVVYQGSGSGDGDGIFMKRVGPDVGAEIRVNQKTMGVQDQPDIAMLSDGTTLVTWRSDGDIYFQRYDTNSKAYPGDQDAPLNTSGVKGGKDETTQAHPAVAGAHGFFTVAWETTETEGISARFVSAEKNATSLYGYNSVTGQNDEFDCTDKGLKSGQRHNPAVAMGAFVAIGWEDQSAGHPGVFVRRFPLPAQ